MNFHEDRWEGKPTEGQYIAIKSLMEKHPSPDLNLWNNLDKLNKLEASLVIASLKNQTPDQRRRNVKLEGAPGCSLTTKQRIKLMYLIKNLGLSSQETGELLLKHSRLGLVDLLTPGTADGVIKALEGKQFAPTLDT